jgi:hypothetical protein
MFVVTAVRFGRVPKREKAKIIEQMQRVNVQCQGSMIDALLADEVFYYWFNVCQHTSQSYVV